MKRDSVHPILVSALLLICGQFAFAEPAEAVEIAFRLPAVKTDFYTTEVWAHLRTPSQNIRLPAFYDGPDEEARQVWKFRYTPAEAGKHAFEIFQGPAGQARSAGVEGLNSFEFEVSSSNFVRAAFVRLDPRQRRSFILGGAPYYPLGHNVAWGKGNNSQNILPILKKMHEAGENWARVWMTHWDHKNLDWVMNKKNTPGKFDLKVARNWDAIVRCAETNSIRLQITLQHHGQYSTKVNSNWSEHPWNAANGGFLKSPVDFFTNPIAKEMTKHKYRYIVARWGYSPSVMAWELFNEVEYTDAFAEKRVADVARWHDEMADYIRSIDVHRHLITTSSLPSNNPVYRKMDYYQPHSYPADLVVAAAGAGSGWDRSDKPIYYGEMGPKGDLGADDGRILKKILWPSMMSEAGGAAQYWPWDVVEKKDLYRFFRSAAKFGEVSRLQLREEKTLVAPRMECSARASLKFGPGGAWGPAKVPEFAVSSDGRPIEGLIVLSPYLHGDPSKITDGFPKLVIFRVDARAPTTFIAEIGTIAKAGAKASLLVDGREVKTEEWAPASKDYEANTRLTAEIPEGRHTVTLKSIGKDWFYVKSFTLTDFAPALAAVGAHSTNFAAAWIYNRLGIDALSEPVTGSFKIADMDFGSYRVVWWDTEKGEPIREESVASLGGSVTLQTPPVSSDVAVFVERK